MTVPKLLVVYPVVILCLGHIEGMIKRDHLSFQNALDVIHYSNTNHFKWSKRSHEG